MNKDVFFIRFASTAIDYFVDYNVRNDMLIFEILDVLSEQTGVDTKFADILIDGDKISDDERLMTIEEIWKKKDLSYGWRNRVVMTAVPQNEIKHQFDRR